MGVRQVRIPRVSSMISVWLQIPAPAGFRLMLLPVQGREKHPLRA